MEVDEALQHFLTMDSSGLRGTWRAEIAVSLKSLSRRSSWSSEPLHCAKKNKKRSSLQPNGLHRPHLSSSVFSLSVFLSRFH